MSTDTNTSDRSSGVNGSGSFGIIGSKPIEQSDDTTGWSVFNGPGFSSLVINPITVKPIKPFNILIYGQYEPDNKKVYTNIFISSYYGPITVRALKLLSYAYQMFGVFTYTDVNNLILYGTCLCGLDSVLVDGNEVKCKPYGYMISFITNIQYYLDLFYQITEEPYILKSELMKCIGSLSCSDLLINSELVDSRCIESAKRGRYEIYLNKFASMILHSILHRNPKAFDKHQINRMYNDHHNRN